MTTPLITRVPPTPFHERIWILPPQLQENAPFVLSSTGITIRDENYHIRRTEGAKYYVLECIISGCGVLEVAGFHCHPQRGDVYLLPSGIPNEYHTDRDNPWEKIWFNISGELVESLIRCYHLEGVIFLQKCNMEPLFRRGMDIIRQGQSDAPVEFAGQLTRIFATMARLHRRGNDLTAAQQMGHALRDYLDSHWKQPYSLTGLSDACGKSPAQVMRIFNAIWHCTPKAYHTRLRLAAAVRYLENTSEPVKAVAQWLGFANAFQFSAWLRKQTGKSPRMYRQP